MDGKYSRRKFKVHVSTSRHTTTQQYSVPAIRGRGQIAESKERGLLQEEEEVKEEKEEEKYVE